MICLSLGRWGPAADTRRRETRALSLSPSLCLARARGDLPVPQRPRRVVYRFIWWVRMHAQDV